MVGSTVVRNVQSMGKGTMIVKSNSVRVMRPHGPRYRAHHGPIRGGDEESNFSKQPKNSQEESSFGRAWISEASYITY